MGTVDKLVEHAIVVLRKSRYDKVRFPDGRIERAPVGRGRERLRAFQDEVKGPIVERYETALEDWEDAFADWADRVEFTAERIRSPGGGRVAVTRIHLPGGQTHDVDPGHEENYLRDQFSSTVLPRPDLNEYLDLDRWIEDSGAQLTSDQRGWHGRILFADHDQEIEDPELGHWFYGFPARAVLNTLNRLSGEGWRVVSVSEDKGLYLGEDASKEAGPVAARYLLSREVAIGDSHRNAAD
jgi:hypothetical protein